MTPATTPATPFYQSGWFIALMSVFGAFMVIGLLGGLGYYIYTKVKGSTSVVEETLDSNSMELHSGRRRMQTRRCLIILNYNYNLMIVSNTNKLFSLKNLIDHHIQYNYTSQNFSS